MSDAIELEGLVFVEEEERSIGDFDGGSAGASSSGDKEDEVLQPLTW